MQAHSGGQAPLQSAGPYVQLQPAVMQRHKATALRCKHHELRCRLLEDGWLPGWRQVQAARRKLLLALMLQLLDLLVHLAFVALTVVLCLLKLHGIESAKLRA